MGQKMNNNNNKTKENQPLIEKTMIAITIVEHLCAKNYTRKQPFLSFTLHTHTHTHTHTNSNYYSYFPIKTEKVNLPNITEFRGLEIEFDPKSVSLQGPLSF